MSNYFIRLLKREHCVNTDPNLDPCEKYVSEFTKSGIPVIIGLCLLISASIVIYFIVRFRRRKVAAEEAAKDRMIDDDVELTWVPIPKSNEHGRMPSPQPASNYAPKDSMQSAPPSYNLAYPPQVQQKNSGRRQSRDSDHA